MHAQNLGIGRLEGVFLVHQELSWQSVMPICKQIGGACACTWFFCHHCFVTVFLFAALVYPRTTIQVIKALTLGEASSLLASL